MKKLVALMAIMLLLMSFAVAIPLTSKAIENNSNQYGNGEQNKIQSNTNVENQGEDSNIQTKNRIKIGEGECPNNCTCTGSVTKCILSDGTREMTVRAGNSGNIIIQVKGVDGTTNVTLYKADDGKLYGVFKNKETKRIKLLPDQVKGRIQERMQMMLENEEIVLNEEGIYEYRAEKKARLFYLIPVRERVRAELNSETGEVIKIRNPWWGFLAKDEKGEPIIGASCGTVTPGYNDECCQNKGYDLWNAETDECEFNDEE